MPVQQKNWIVGLKKLHLSTFLVDTGATNMSVLTHRIGLQKGAPMQFRTANGNVIGYATYIDSLWFGNIEGRKIRASINPGMLDEQVLLGMSFLKYLKLAQEGDTLRLSGPQ